MATFTTTSGKRLTKADSSSSADTYVVSSDSLGLVLTGNASGDTIKIDGLSTDFTYKASGKTLTLTSIDTPTFKIQVQLAAAGSVTLGFLDGGVTASYASSGSAKGVTLAGSAGTQKLTTKSAELAATVTIDEAKASVSTFDTTTSSTTTTTTTSSTGSNFVLSTNVDAVSGTANNDVIVGLIGTSGTFTVGDNIDGGSGTDTLNLIDASGTAGGFVSINGVETINVRTLVTAGADVTELNAIDWSGVATLSNASSFSDSELNVSGLSITTQVRLVGNTDINVDFSNTTTGSVSIAIVGSGVYDSTASTLGSASGVATANINLNDSVEGLISGVAISLVGSSLAKIEAGTAAANFTVSGAGNAVLVTDDTISTFNASQASGNIDVTFQGASDVTVNGGAGSDIFRFGTTISNGDSVNGGGGADAVYATIQGFSRSLLTTNVETAQLSFKDDAGGSFNVTGSTVTTYNLLGDSAGADANIAGILGGAVVNLTSGADALDDVSIGAVSGASSLVINFGTASGSVAVDAASIGGAASVTLAAATNTTGTNTIASATFDAATRSIAISTVGGDADFNVSDLFVGGATALTIVSNGSAGIDIGTGISGTSLASVTVRANGTDAADVSVDAIENSTGLTLVTLDANSGADIFVSGTGIEFGNGASAGVLTAVLNLQAETNSLVGTAASGGSGIRVSTTGAMNLTINIAADVSGGVHVGTATLALGSATAETTAVLNISAGSIGSNAIVRLEKIDIDGQTGTQVNVGAVTVGASAQFVLASGGIDATNVDNADVSALNITIAASGFAEIGAITTTAGSLNGVTVVAADGASATFGNVVASSMGAVSLTVASGASANFGTVLASGSAGGSFAGSVGAITLNGSDAGGVTFGTIGASAVGAITVSGALDVTFGTITANRVGSINAANQGASGSFSIDLSGVSGAAEIVLGAATNTVVSGNGNDVITLKVGSTGNDVIRFTSTAQGVDNIIGFFAGSTGLDQLELATAMGSAIITAANGSAVANASDADLSVVITGTGTTLAAADNVIVIGTAFASTAAMQTFLSTGVALASAAVATATFVVVWTDGSDSYVSLLGATGAGSAAATTLGSGGHTLSTTTLAVLQGVTPGALVAANFDFV